MSFELKNLNFEKVAPVIYWKSIEEDQLLNNWAIKGDRSEELACEELDARLTGDDSKLKLYVDRNEDNKENLFLTIPILCSLKGNGAYDKKFNEKYYEVINVIFALDVREYFDFAEGLEEPYRAFVATEKDSAELWRILKAQGLEWFSREDGGANYILRTASGSEIKVKDLLAIKKDQIEEYLEQGMYGETLGVFKSKDEALIIASRDVSTITTCDKNNICHQFREPYSLGDDED